MLERELESGKYVARWQKGGWNVTGKKGKEIKLEGNLQEEKKGNWKVTMAGETERELESNYQEGKRNITGKGYSNRIGKYPRQENRKGIGK